MIGRRCLSQAVHLTRSFFTTSQATPGPRTALCTPTSSCAPTLPSRCYCSEGKPQYSGNFYLMLDVKMTATTEEIKTAYYRLSKKYHPDINASNDAAERFSRLTEAYSVLSNDETRETYDKWLTTGLGGYSPKRNYPEPGEHTVRDRFGTFGTYYRRGR